MVMLESQEFEEREDGSDTKLRMSGNAVLASKAPNSR